MKFPLEVKQLLQQANFFIPSRLYGGDGGVPFDTRNNYGIENEILTGIVVRAGSDVDGITSNYGGTVFSYGGNGESENEMCLRDDEFITQVDVKCDDIRVRCLTFTTNTGRILGPCWLAGGYDNNLPSFAVKAPPDWMLVGLFVRSGAVLDAIGFLFGPKRLKKKNHRGTGFFNQGIMIKKHNNEDH
eukprot:CAMPEP_0172438636 /NCGR_PEP_ID=MMETSP1064-20121228/72900_1 /TAXON_ID=202472 /ORGANISM="Aulacoseira subarctica , Strain CCAP 1002/5" /LENGTH=186 /DNA_ID=CAMNT_0013187199 /DNA_START=627 /DNA_END=1186 /DNA_ORIENTATION=+